MHLVLLTLLLATICNPLYSSEISEEIRELHKRVLVLDSHLDTPIRLAMPGFDITERHEHPADQSQVDLPRMLEGGLDGGFWVIYTSQGELTETAYAAVKKSAFRTGNLIRKMVSDHPNEFSLALSADDAKRIADNGKISVYMSIENAYPIGTDLSVLDQFYAIGVRMLGLVHVKNNQFADSSTDPLGPRWNGLSPLGRQLVQKANDLGMIIDASHAHDLALEQMISLSRTPILLSHSGCKSVFDHPRNVGDKLLLKLKNQGGVIQLNSLGAYLKTIEIPEGRKAIYKTILRDRALGEINNQPMLYKDFVHRFNAMYKRFPKEMASLDHYLAHFEHGLDLMGSKAVGVGADWDGGGGVTEMNDVSKIPYITKFLSEKGYDEKDINDIWSGNLLRLLRQAEFNKLK